MKKPHPELMRLRRSKDEYIAMLAQSLPDDASPADLYKLNQSLYFPIAKVVLKPGEQNK